MSDVELWQAARAGDGRAFADLFKRHRDAVLRQALRFLSLLADAEEVVAGAFFELWRRRDSARLVDGSLLPWLLATAANLSRNGMRAARRREALLDRLVREHQREDASPVPWADAGVDRLELMAALRSLSSTDAALLTMVALEGYRPGDAAAVLGISNGAARNRLSRSRAKLRGVLHALIDTPDATKEPA